ncbi:hypothetical protein EJB05_02883, partial [Eragrostis curvula]
MHIGCCVGAPPLKLDPNILIVPDPELNAAIYLELVLFLRLLDLEPSSRGARRSGKGHWLAALPPGFEAWATHGTAA